MQTLEAAQRSSADHEREGRWDDAYLGYEQVVQLCARAGLIRPLVGTLLAQARVLHLSGRAEAALELAELALQISRRCELGRESARATNMVGFIRHGQQAWSDANRSYVEALELARTVADDELIAAICQNLGVVATATGKLREARALFLEAICASVRFGIAVSAASAYNNLGMVCSDLGEWMESEVYFQRGIELAERLDDRSLLARMTTGCAEPLIHTGEFERAESTLVRAEALGVQLDDPVVLADVHRFRGTMARLRGDFEAATLHLERAARIAELASLDLELAEVMEETARLRRAEGRMGAARVLLHEALRNYRRLGATSDIVRMERAAGEWRPRAASPSDQGIVSPPSTAMY